ncbi:hypothetical protein GCM10027258_94050 [Amycolatopsis stemonae]
MGRHTRDDDPVPHPQDRTGRPAAPRRPHPGDAAGAPSGAPQPVAGRGEASGSYPVTGRGDASGSHPVARRGEASGSYPVTGRGETSGSYPVTSRGEASGSYPVTGRGETSGSYPVTGRGETSGSYPVTGRGETSGSYPVTGRSEASGAFRTPGRSSISDAFGIAGRGRGEASGSYPVAGRSETSGSFFVSAGEATGSQQAARRGEASGAYPVASRGEAPVARRGETSGAYPVATRGEESGAAGLGDQPTSRRGKGGGQSASRRGRRGEASSPAETAAERTEVITRHGETSGNYPITARSETSRTLSRKEAAGESSRRRVEPAGESEGRRRAPGRSETTGPHRAEGKSETTGPHRAEGKSETTGPHRAEGKSETTGPHRAEGKSETTGSHRVAGKSEATGSHRIVGKKAPRRRIAGWPIACAVLAALIGLGVIGWNWADSELNSRAEAQAAACSGGTSQMRIVVTPSVQKPLTAAADRWNQAATVVHGQCVHVTIDAKPSSEVLDALVGRSNLNAIGGLPAAWLPESSYWISELTTKKPEMIGSAAQSVANARSADYPFVGLSGQGIDDTVLRAAQTFREYLEQPAQQADFAAAGIKGT